MLEDLLICPITHLPLQWANEEKTSVMTQDGGIYYPVIEGIFLLLPRYAVRADQSQVRVDQDPIKVAMQSFYDEVGWQATPVIARHEVPKQSSSVVYQDAADSEDLRAVSQSYIKKCHQRVKSHLPSKGKYLLDIACGPIQYPEYLTYSSTFDYRICADLSLTALREAKKRLKNKGIYILCDITQLPFQDNAVDAVISLHTLYHVPSDQQAKGFEELHRVLKPKGKSVVVYSWGVRSLLMNISMFPFKLASRIRRFIFSRKAPLYFHTHSYKWFCEEIQKKYHTQLFCWRSVNVPFLKVFIHPLLGGKAILQALFWIEERFPYYMGRLGAYPLFVSEKK